MINILIVWSITGLWHGASWNFLLWGLYYGILLMIEKLFLYNKLKKAPGWVGHVYTMLLVIVGWMIFAMEDIHRMTAYLGVMLGTSGAKFLSAQVLYYLKNYAVILMVLVFAALPMGKAIYGKMKEQIKCVFEPVAIVLMLLVCTAYLVDSTYNPFLYFRF